MSEANVNSRETNSCVLCHNAVKGDFAILCLTFYPRKTPGMVRMLYQTLCGDCAKGYTLTAIDAQDQKE